MDIKTKNTVWKGGAKKGMGGNVHCRTAGKKTLVGGRLASLKKTGKIEAWDAENSKRLGAPPSLKVVRPGTLSKEGSEPARRGEAPSPVWVLVEQLNSNTNNFEQQNWARKKLPGTSWGRIVYTETSQNT